MMTRILALLFVVVVFSCKNEESGTTRFDNVPLTDSTCRKDLEKAKKDLTNGKIVYCHYAGNIFFNELRCEKQMTELLRQYKITFKNETSGCIIYEGQTEHCYCELMDEKIKQKYGPLFLDSLLAIADSFYVFKNPLDTFHYSKCDTWPRYPEEFENTEFSYKLQNAFDAKVKYPKGYLVKEQNNTSAFTDVSFIVDKNGGASHVEFKFIFDYEGNAKYEEYLMSVITPLISNTEWQPATIRRQKVISDMVVRIGFD